ncbi:Transposon Ty3-G Gag-Pol polyprotein [Araneus ventricosus]|uniref:Transposon Ty3-G Gag-Pol polyprotein n=1 Tax=Araneus ventricosus TaxID=182803 RepID=A0A4Y2K3C6_ARAVE|nr:Transposon Ty3-G Gag-Pol polyprotein [Araneus ventricosus]
MCRAAETFKLQAQVCFTEQRSTVAIRRFKPSLEVRPRDTGQANKFRQPAKRQESSRRKCQYCGSHHVSGLTASADKLGLIRKSDNVNSVNCCESISKLLCKYNQVFEGLGNLPSKYLLTLRENSLPVVSATRKVAFSLLDPLKAELDRIVKAGVIEKVTESTDWVSPLVRVQKKNVTLRVCLDPQNLNRAIKRPQYNLPTFEDITSKLAGAKYFSVLDAVSAFWQTSLDEESSRLCKFSFPFGRFIFLRIPYGMKCAPERFQRVVAEMLEDIQNADKFFDDSIVWGHALSSDSIAVDKSKLEPILSMSKPEDWQRLHRYLGIINYLSKFLPNLSLLIAPLRELIKNNTVWLWNPSHHKILDRVKEQITKSPVLAFFDPRVESEIDVDASPFGLGAVLQQRGKPIAFASSILTSNAA